MTALLPALPNAEGIFWLVLTCALYALGARVRARLGGSLYAQPLIWASLVLIIILLLGDVPLTAYRSGGDWLIVALALSTVAIGVPIYDNRHIIRALAKPFLWALAAGATGATLLAVIPAYVLGLNDVLVATLATKSVTTPIAMGLAQEIGGLPVLAMLIVVFTGNIAVLMSPLLFRLAGIGTSDTNDIAARGLALGVVATGIGTAEAVRASHLMGSFAGLAMGVNGVLTGLLLPLFF